MPANRLVFRSLMWRFGFLLTVLVGLSFSLKAQRTCATQAQMIRFMQAHPAWSSKWEHLQRYLTGNRIMHPAYPAFQRTGTYSIPVVVHIVLQDPSQVSDQQVASQIAVLNQDYNAANGDTSRIPDAWKGLLGNMHLQFCLAARNPDGDPTDGIIRVSTSVQAFSVDNACSSVKFDSSGGSNAWDPASYLNIWVCNLSGNNLGVSTPPGIYPDNQNGVVIQYTAFGTVGNLEPAFNLGRSCTHEIGHYFNLLHPWGLQTGSCSPGDYVADTPPESEPAYGCPAFPDLSDFCSPDSPGIMFDNFMGYANDSCMSLFTAGQVARMQQALMNDRSSLLTSTGCQPVTVMPLDAQIKRIREPYGKLCSPSFIPVVVLKNKGSDTLKSVQIQVATDDGPVASMSWTGSLPAFDSTLIQLPAQTTTPGMHTFTAYTSLPNGQPDQQPSNDTARISFHYDVPVQTPFFEGFETPAFPPPGWDLSNPDGSITWTQTSAAAHSGTYSVVMRNFIYPQNGPTDDLISPLFNLSGMDSAFLSFYVAAAVQSDPHGNNTYWDTLKVLVSQDCGQTTQPVYVRWGPNLITDSLPDNSEFVPDAHQWRKDSIDLSAYIGKGPFQLIFRNICNFENDIYLDDIHLRMRNTNPILKQEKILVVPNPSRGDIAVEFLYIPADLKAVEIYNAAGQMLQRKLPSAIERNRLDFDLSREPDGLYFVRLVFTHGNQVKRIIKLQ